MPIIVSIVEDDDRVRESLAVLINGSEGFRCHSTYPNAEAALNKIPFERLHVVLMDINLPGLSGIECVRKLKTIKPKLQIVMLTVYEDSERIFQALQAGATGYILKQTPPAEILQAIAETHRGGAPMSCEIARKVVQSFHDFSPETEKLTRHEREILDDLASGYYYKEIAERLNMTFDGVHYHLRNIYAKLHVRSRTEAVLKYRQL